ncbi:MAG: hypothetical protein R3194_09225, partial [Limnobacter sp.]|nr:hypothetical protein [Limnobacter sp.]
LAGYFLRTTPVRVPKTRFDQFLELALPELLALPWPGNVRQLKNFCKRAAVMMVQESDLTRWRSWFPDLLGNEVAPPAATGPHPGLHQLALSYHQAGSTQERASLIEQALRLTHGQVKGICSTFGISRSTVWRAKQILTKVES